MVRRIAAWLAALLWVATSSAHAQVQPDTTAAGTRSIRVQLDDGTEVRAKRVGIGSMGNLRVVLDNGRDSIVATSRVRRIEDEKGRDRTHEVLVAERRIRVGGPAPSKRDDPPPHMARWLVSAHGSAANPAGNFKHSAANGYAADLGIERRSKRHVSYGLRADIAGFGGDTGFEELLASTYSGAVDQLDYRYIGASLFGRYFFLPGRRVDPFLLGTLGVGNLRVTLSGPDEEATSSSVSTAGEVGLGFAIGLGPHFEAELLGSYGGMGSGQRFMKTKSVSLSVDGDVQYFRFSGGIVHRFGSSG